MGQSNFLGELASGPIEALELFLHRHGFSGLRVQPLKVLSLVASLTVFWRCFSPCHPISFTLFFDQAGLPPDKPVASGCGGMTSCSLPMSSFLSQAMPINRCTINAMGLQVLQHEDGLGSLSGDRCHIG